jgi:hypothetical protein
MKKVCKLRGVMSVIIALEIELRLNEYWSHVLSKKFWPFSAEPGSEIMPFSSLSTTP